MTERNPIRHNGEASKKTQYLQNAALIFIAGAVGAGAGVAGITWRSHRELTHRSIELSPLLQKLADLEQRSLGISEPTLWAAVHRIHHQMTDASLFPFYKINHAIQEATMRGIPVPETFEHLDPYVTSFTRQQVEAIGSHGDAVVRERLGDTYEKPIFGSDAEIQTILHPTEPKYFYPDYKKQEGKYSQDDLARILLTDPHSPALIPPRNGKKNGVRGVAKSNVFLYSSTAAMFRERPDLKPTDLQTGKEDQQKSSARAVAGGFILPSLGVLAYRKLTGRGGLKPKDFVIAAVAGSAINGLKMGLEIAGGNIVNSFGHAGKLDTREMLKAATKREYHVVLNPDGTLTTDTVYSGALGKIFGWSTLDEVGGQAYHHAHPDAIAYTAKTGLPAWFDAPWGSLTSYLAESKFPFVKPGKGFEGQRPDIPHEGVLLIQNARAEEFAVARR
ncbi:MAG TPA: hypothetical protein VE090_03740 [Methylomirabilota bacterium]|nr:hypothetical protein [Methylomirabilota bacterium]